jgi:peptide-methionine (S)-S-oxide reductase
MHSVVNEIGFGGGCHWCTEAVFQSLRGVHAVAQGFVCSDPPFDTWSEAVVVKFDETEIDLGTLIEIHLRTHASTSNHSKRGKYRSAIYTFSDEQALETAQLLKSLQARFNENLVTQVLPHRGFRCSEKQFQNYYKQGPERPFCQTYIDPKLQLLREQFSRHVR